MVYQAGQASVVAVSGPHLQSVAGKEFLTQVERFQDIFRLMNGQLPQRSHRTGVARFAEVAAARRVEKEKIAEAQRKIRVLLKERAAAAAKRHEEQMREDAVVRKAGRIAEAQASAWAAHPRTANVNHFRY